MQFNQSTRLVRLYLLILLSVSIPLIGGAQAPQGLNYQAIARNSAGAVLPTQHIRLRLTITDGNGGSTLYRETDTTSTNQFGLFTINIGGGTLDTTLTFSSISWGTKNPWLKVEMDPSGGTNYITMGSSELLSVPYALFAASGNQGTPGTNGTNGSTWYTGSGAPPGGLGAVNDLYLNTFNSQYYKKTGATTWTMQGSLTLAYIAGAGISIVGDTISATGGGSLGQNSSSSYSSSQLTLDPLNAGSFIAIPGVKQTITVPANCSVNVSTFGGIQNLGVFNGDFAEVDIAIGIDGPYLPGNAGEQSVFVPNSTTVGQTLGNWSMTQSLTLSAGTHTIDLYAAWDADSGVEGSANAVQAHVGSSVANSVLRSVLTVTIIKN